MHTLTDTASALTMPPINVGGTDLMTTAQASNRAAWSDDDWASYINAPEANPVLAIIERGRRLKERRDACDQRGDRSNTFAAFCTTKLRMSRETAHRYIRIAEWAESCDTHVTTLPPSFGAIYELSRFPQGAFNDAVRSGKIRPEMTRADVEALRGNLAMDTATPASPSRPAALPSPSEPPAKPAQAPPAPRPQPTPPEPSKPAKYP